MELILQLHGGSRGGGGGNVEPLKQNAPGSMAAATIDGATEGERQRIFEKMGRAKGKNFTNKTGNQLDVNSVKKMLLGE